MLVVVSAVASWVPSTPAVRAGSLYMAKRSGRDVQHMMANDDGAAVPPGSGTFAELLARGSWIESSNARPAISSDPDRVSCLTTPGRTPAPPAPAP
eukprot:2600664-Prymnesium_polylepis.1